MSSSCFYPLETEKSLKKCGELGFSNVELFVNTYSELIDPIKSEFKRIKDDFDIQRQQNMDNRVVDVIPQRAQFSILVQYYIRGRRCYSKLPDA